MNYRMKDGSRVVIDWDVKDWDWDKHDFSWLSSQLSLPDSGFFIHGGRVRHQRHVPLSFLPKEG